METGNIQKTTTQPKSIKEYKPISSIRSSMQREIPQSEVSIKMYTDLKKNRPHLQGLKVPAFREAQTCMDLSSPFINIYIHISILQLYSQQLLV